MDITISGAGDREHSFVVDYRQSRSIPAKLTGNPDTWAPAEGGEIEIERVVMLGPGARERVVDMSEMTSHNATKIHKAVEEANRW